MVCMKCDYLLKKVDKQAELIVNDSLRKTTLARGLRYPAEKEFFGRSDIRTDKDLWCFWTAVHETAIKWKSFTVGEVATNINENLLKQAESRQHQGQLIRSWVEAEVSQTKVVRKWLREVSDIHLKFYIKASLQLLYTPAYKRMTNKTKNLNGNCVCGQLGTQMHILNECSWRREDIIRRHNRVQDAFLSMFPRKPNDIIFTDTHIGPILCRGHYIEKDKPDVVVINHNRREFTIIEFTVPYDRRLAEAQKEKIEKYCPLIAALSSNYRGYNIKFIPIIVGALGGTLPEMTDWLELAGIGEWWNQREVRVRMRKAAIGGSFSIWTKKSAGGENTSATA